MPRIFQSLFLAAVGSILSGHIAAQHFTPGEWIEIPNELAGRTLLLNIKTIVPDGPYMKAWLLTDWEEKQSVASQVYSSVLQVDLYACEKRTFATRTMQLYEGRLRTGKLVRSINRQPQELTWNEVPPGSPSEGILDAVCKGRSKGG